MVTFIDQHRATYGVEPICRVVPIAPSTYFRWKAAQADPTNRSTRAVRDEVLKAIIQRIGAKTTRPTAPGRSGSRWAGAERDR